MFVQSLWPMLGLAIKTWKAFVPVTFYVLLVSWLDLKYHLEDFTLPIPLVAIPGTVIGLLLGFRTNSSYARWWEARILWGAIVNDSRTWVRQIIEFSGTSESEGESPWIRPMAFRQIAWCYALSRSLGHQDPLTDVRSFLSANELATLTTRDNVPNILLLKQAVELRRLYQENHLGTYPFVELERTLARLTDSMGGCERIKNTPFPASYSVLVHGATYLFIFFLPFALTGLPTVGLIVTSLVFALGFLAIDHVAIYLEDPFEDRPSATPTHDISRTIESNIRQMLDERRIPTAQVAVKNILD